MSGIFVLNDMKKKISIQGFEGSFHQVAAQQFFGKEIEVVCCSTFKEVIKVAEHKKESAGGDTSTIW